MATYEEHQPGRHPTYLRGRWGLAWGRILGAAKDLVLEGAKDAVRAGFIKSAPVDALPYHLADAALEALPGETSDSQRTRVEAAFESARNAGLYPGLDLAAAQLGFEGYVFRTARSYLPGLPPDHRADLPSTWWLFVPSFGHPWLRTEWGASTWGSGTWGSSASVTDVARVKRLLRAQSPARARAFVRLFFDGATAWGSSTWGAGLWGPSGSWIDWTVE